MLYFPTHIEPAEVYIENGVPISKKFDDVYYSKEGVVQEIDHVFINGNHLRARFLDQAEGTCFCVGEMGFGTGFNFLQTWRVWADIQAQKKSSTCKLLFVSAELHPLRLEDLRQALLGCGLSDEEMGRQVNALLDKYPPLVGGYHLIEFSPQVKLLLMLGDATAMWSEFSGKVDAWFLDGFNPAKNESMWSPALFQEIAKHSKKGTTLSSFSVASVVKNGLSACGFAVKKEKGFGRKREMTTATFELASETASTKNAPKKKIGIIGAGLAGLWLGAKLKERHIDCIIWEKDTPASKASGNDIGLISPYLNKANNPTAAFLMMSFLYAKQLLARHNELANFEGIHQISKNEVQRSRLSYMASEANYPPTFLKAMDDDFRHFLLAEGGCGFPKKICQYLIDTYHLPIRTKEEVTHIQRKGERWGVTTKSGTTEVDTLVLANGEGVFEFSDLTFPALSVSKGVLFRLDRKHCDTPPYNTKFGKYICTSPALDASYFGGVYKETEGTLSEIYNAWTKEVSVHLPSLFGEEDAGKSSYTYRLCDRTNTSDRLPLVGCYPEEKENNLHFHSNLFLNVGHGSRGLTTAPLVAEIIASILNDEPLPIPQSTWNAIASDRFWKRKYKIKSKN